MFARRSDWAYGAVAMKGHGLVAKWGLLGVCMACGNAETGENTGGAAGSAAGAGVMGGTSALGGGSENGGASTPGGTSHSGGSAAGTSSGAAAGGQGLSSSLMPLAEGRSWTFEVSAVDPAMPQGTCPNATAIVEGMAPAPGGGTGFKYRPACVSPDIFYTMIQNGDDIAAYRNGSGASIEYMKTPVSEGANWSLYVWHQATEQTVPAGTFSDCWRRELVSDANDYVIFCRGIGPVRTESAILNVRTLLVSKNF
jgi:hypothetical protein